MIHDLLQRTLTLVACAAVGLLAACSPPPVIEPPGEWWQFRGPAGQGISTEENLPQSWRGISDNVRWKAHVPGSGNSTPIISRGKVFLTTVYGNPDDSEATAGRHPIIKRVVLAYDLETGEKLWEKILFEGPRGQVHFSNTHAAPTPVTDGRYVYVSFDAHLAALDFDGNVVWHHDVDPDYYEFSHYGVSSSPVLAGAAVILLQDKEQGEHEAPGWIAAFDRDSGEEIWRDEWSHTCCSYNTPIVVERGGRLEVWNTTALEVVSYDARTGEKIWVGKHPTMQTVPSLVRVGDDMFCAPGGIHTRAIVMFHLCPPGEGVRPMRVWTSSEAVPEMSSPVVYRGKLFTVGKGGAFYVRDPDTGETLWRKRLPSGSYRGSLVAGDGKVYVINTYGITTVIDAESNPPRVLARNPLPTGSSASPAIADGSIFLRSADHLYRIDKESGELPALEPDPDEPDAAEPAAAG